MTKSSPPTLREVQALFQDAVLNGRGDILPLLEGNSRTTGDVLLGVYRHAYKARLIAIIEGDYPALASYLSAAAFQDLAGAYLAAHPSRTPNARWVSRQLVEFVRDRRPDDPAAYELAALERALADAFDAPDVAVLDLAGLQAVPAERWGELSFVPHSSCVVLEHTTNAFAIWRALKDGNEPVPRAVSQEPQALLVWRAGATASVRVFGPEEAMMWTEAVRGVPFGSLCQLLATFGDPGTAALRAAQYLMGWLASGALREARICEPSPRTCGERALD